MTLDDFLRVLENLIEDQESVEDPGKGNFSCEDCRSCNNCRFCVGCDSCEDCTYCEECIDATSCTQSKRCVSCEKVSYCEDCRDCKGSRYLTLCVECKDCVHCLACVGLEGGEFYVLNERRTRKEYFALLRQVQELMGTRMGAGWRPPGIGLASDIYDPAVAGSDRELSAAPWLDEILGGDPPLAADPGYDEGPAAPAAAAERYDAPGYDERREPSWEPRREQREPRPESGRPRPDRRPDRDRGEYTRERPPHDEDWDDRAARDPRTRDGREPLRGARRSEPRRSEREPERDWMSEPPEFGSSYADERTTPRTRRREPSAARPIADYGSDLGRDLGQEEDWYEPPRGEPSRGEPTHGEPARSEPRPEARPAPRPRYDDDYGDDYGDDYDDVPQRSEQAQTQPFAREKAEPRYDPSRPASRDPLDLPRSPEQLLDDDLAGLEPAREPAREALRRAEGPEAPGPREREPSSPWLDDNPAQARRRAKRGSLRRAGRPKRPDRDPEDRPPEGTGSYRTGSAPERTGTGTSESTGLRLGRRPKRR